MIHEMLTLLTLLHSRGERGIKREVLPWLVFILKIEGGFDIRYNFDLRPEVGSRNLDKHLKKLLDAEYISIVGADILVISVDGETHLRESLPDIEDYTRALLEILASYIDMDLLELAKSYPFKEKMGDQ